MHEFSSKHHISCLFDDVRSRATATLKSDDIALPWLVSSIGWALIVDN